jgi:hypothetical protein
MLFYSLQPVRNLVARRSPNSWRLFVVREHPILTGTSTLVMKAYTMLGSASCCRHFVDCEVALFFLVVALVLCHQNSSKLKLLRSSAG